MESKGQEPRLDFGEGEGEDLGAHCEVQPVFPQRDFILGEGAE